MFYSITVTFPDESSAKKITFSLLEERLVACANLYPVESAYWWKERIEESREWVAEFKTQSHLYAEIEQAIKKAHPYENPCIIAHPLEKGSKDYLQWIRESTREPPGD